MRSAELIRTAEVVQQIEDARDGLGVITPTALHTQLGALTAADWRAATAAYPKSPTVADGFYIEDQNGETTIHNDLRRAHELADNSVVHTTLEDAKIVAAVAVGLDVVVAGTAGDMAYSSVLMGGATLGASLGVAGSAALGFGAVLGVAGAAIFAADLARNAYRKSQAQEDIRSAAELHWS